MATARMAWLDVIQKEVVPQFIQPTPCRAPLKKRFKNLPRFKSNPCAKRGGGTLFYNVAGVERFLKQRTLPGAGQ
jgi:hypothetical protein